MLNTITLFYYPTNLKKSSSISSQQKYDKILQPTSYYKLIYISIINNEYSITLSYFFHFICFCKLFANTNEQMNDLCYGIYGMRKETTHRSLHSDIK